MDGTVTGPQQEARRCSGGRRSRVQQRLGQQLIEQFVVRQQQWRLRLRRFVGQLVGMPSSVDLFRRRLLGWPLAAAGLPWLDACSPRSSATPGLAHDFYVWQRVWSAPLEQALLQAAPGVREWRVLSLQVGMQHAPFGVAVNWAALAATQRPVVAVVRIEGSRLGAYDASLSATITRHLQDVLAHGATLAGIEIDHDCATSQLAAYAAWLRDLRASWQAEPALSRLPLSITALPAWRVSPDLPPLLRTADESVLQVHAVQRPSTGLFDADTARHWAQAWVQIAPHPFRLALPCYASRVGYDEWGQALAVESEAGVTLRSTREQELTASPREVSALLTWFKTQMPEHLAGIAWFRLPMANDQRAWRLATWQAVVQGRVQDEVDRALTVSLQPATADGDAEHAPGLFDVVLRNTADFDVDLPAAIALPASAQAADGLQGYAIDLLNHPARLVRRQAGWLRPHSMLTIGWTRLASSGHQETKPSDAEPSIVEH